MFPTPATFRDRPSRRAARHAGFTLLEVILALAIAALVLGAIGMAIDFHLRALDRGRRSVEQAQLARAVLRRIADDLRGTVQHIEVDYESLVPQTPSAANIASAASALGGSSSGRSGGNSSSGNSASGNSSGNSGATGSSGNGSSANISGGNSASGASSSSSEEDVSTTSGLPPSIPGLYGRQYDLEVDVSRLPRPDEYGTPAMTSGLVADQPSDVKTVTYYVRQATADLPGGLVRRAIDRAATSYAVDQAELSELDAAAVLIAPEVQTIEFEYFTGVANSPWLTEWDSQTQEGLPMAVRITITLAPTGEAAKSASTADPTDPAAATATGPVYRLTVHLPGAEVSESAAGSTTSEEDSASDSSGSNSSSSSANSSSNSSGTGGSTP